ncbi:MAG TPA: hypothetical protein VGS21_11925, partial [Acidimicrobiales bacterium]|nr:hypothetical protein [Acidimicrobiales bacterium]
MNAEELARRTYGTVRKGYDPAEVRAAIAAAVDELRAAERREEGLRRDLADAVRKANSPALDEETLTAALGAETARVLQTAHEAAREVVARGEASAKEIVSKAEHTTALRIEEAELAGAKLLDEAGGEAESRRATARVEAEAMLERAKRDSEQMVARARRDAEQVSTAARSEAERLIEATKSECIESVREARQLRSRILHDLADRRQVLRTELEELLVGRATLLDAVGTVRDTVERLTDRLSHAADDVREPSSAPYDQLIEDIPEEVIEAGTLRAHDLFVGGDDAAATAPDLEDSEELDEDAGDAEDFEDAEDLEDDEETEDLEGDGGDVAEAEIAGEADDEDASGDVGEDLDEETTREAEDDDAPAGIEDAGAVAHAEPAEPAEPEIEEFALEIVEHGEVEGVVIIGATDVRDVAPVPPGASDAPGAVEQPAEAGREEPHDHEHKGVEALFAKIRASRAERVAKARDLLQATSPTAEPDAPVEAAAEESPAASVTDEEGATAEATDQTESAADAGEDEPAAVEPALGEDEEELSGALRARNEMLDPVVAKLTRALKRALQDDQNDFLDKLRQAPQTASLDDVVAASDQEQRIERAVEGAIGEARRYGAEFALRGAGGGNGNAAPPAAAADLEAAKVEAHALASELVVSLRQRIESGLGELAGIRDGAVPDLVGAAYREWKGTRVEELAGDHATRSFADGQMQALQAAGGTVEVTWLVDDGGNPCPDCDDNALAGPQAPGEPFPTGQLHPPVHPGCRCLLVSAAP